MSLLHSIIGNILILLAEVGELFLFLHTKYLNRQHNNIDTSATTQSAHLDMPV